MPLRRTYRPRPESLRIWPLAVAGALVLLALNGTSLAYKLGWLGGNPNISRQIGGSGMEGIGSTLIAQRPTLVPLRATVPTYRHNLQFGNPNANITLTIFTDPACAPCRNTVEKALRPLPLQNLRLVYKIWPQNPADPTIGILTQLAYRTGYIEAFWRNLHASARSYSASELLTMLEQSGLPLQQQQQALATQTDGILVNLNEDFALARKLNIGTPPQFFLNDYVIDGQLLTPGNLALYITRLQRSQPLVQSSDYWVNP